MLLLIILLSIIGAIMIPFFIRIIRLHLSGRIDEAGNCAMAGIVVAFTMACMVIFAWGVYRLFYNDNSTDSKPSDDDCHIQVEAVIDEEIVNLCLPQTMLTANYDYGKVVRD